MKKIFLFLSFYEIYQIVFSINKKNDDFLIILLNDIDISILKKSKINIIQYNSIGECVLNSDTIITNNSLCRKIKKCEEKKIINIQNRKYMIPNRINNSFINNEKITMVVVSLGICTAPITIKEILFNFFNDSQSSLKSNSSSLLFKNKEIFYDNYDLSLIFFDSDNDFENLRKLYCFFKNKSIDYIIFLVDYDFNCYKEVNNHIKCFFSKDIDLFIKSRWLSIGENLCCHMDYPSKRQYNKKIIDFENKKLRSILEEDIITKLTIGEEIKVIKWK